MIKKFLSSNETQYRLLRTIVQGIIGVVIANLDLIFGYFILDITLRGIIVALVMAILSPIMSLIGNKVEEDNEL